MSIHIYSLIYVFLYIDRLDWMKLFAIVHSPFAHFHFERYHLEEDPIGSFGVSIANMYIFSLATASWKFRAQKTVFFGFLRWDFVAALFLSRWAVYCFMFDELSQYQAPGSRPND